MKAAPMHADVRREFSRINPAPEEERAAFEERMRKLQLADRVDTNLARCNVPTIYRRAQVRDLSTVADFARTQYAVAVAKVRDVIDCRPVIVALFGHRGPGKTTIACAMVLESCREDHSGRWLDAGDYFDFLKRTYRDGSRREEGDVENEWINPDLLVIDKLETAANTEWEDRKLQRLIVKRYELGRRTILVSNDTAQGLSSRLGESVVDRLRDGGLMIHCNWPSLRGATR